jgi:hypothetical protein
MLSALKLKIQTAPFSNIIAPAMIYEFGHGELLAFTSVVVDPPILNDLCKRPMSAEGRIQPCEMQGHHVSHRMLGPCCLCPMIDTNKPDYIEAAIYKASTGEQAGRYIASCVKDACGYFGKTFLISHSGCSLHCPWRTSMISHVPQSTMGIEVSCSQIVSQRHI